MDIARHLIYSQVFPGMLGIFGISDIKVRPDIAGRPKMSRIPEILGYPIFRFT